MLGARADIADFCHKKPVFDYQEKLVEILGKLDNTLSNFNKNNTEKGVKEEMNHFEELLEKYGFTAEDLDFDYANMSDEELDVAFEEFSNKKFDDEDQDGGDPAGDDPEENEPEDDPEPTNDEGEEGEDSLV